MSRREEPPSPPRRVLTDAAAGHRQELPLVSVSSAPHPPWATLARARMKNVNAYSPWTPSRDAALIRGHRAGASVGMLSEVLGRTELAIGSRLFRLGLIEDWQLRELTAEASAVESHVLLMPTVYV